MLLVYFTYRYACNSESGFGQRNRIARSSFCFNEFCQSECAGWAGYEVSNKVGFSKKNFTGKFVEGYNSNKAIITKEAAVALSNAQEDLNKIENGDKHFIPLNFINIEYFNLLIFITQKNIY